MRDEYNEHQLRDKLKGLYKYLLDTCFHGMEDALEMKDLMQENFEENLRLFEEKVRKNLEIKQVIVTLQDNKT